MASAQDTKKTDFTKSYQLMKRLLQVYSVECGADIMPFEHYLGYNKKLVYEVPVFALNVLEKVKDTDIIIATRAVLFGMTHCPNCDNPVETDMINCPKCNATLPKNAIFFKGLNVMYVSKETGELLKTISADKILVNENEKLLSPVEEKSTKEIIASLINEVRNCPDCGMEIVPSNASYCWNCGSEIEKRHKQFEEGIIVSLPLNDAVKNFLNKLAMEELKKLDEYSWQIDIQTFCDTLIENELASPQLCKKIERIKKARRKSSGNFL